MSRYIGKRNPVGVIPQVFRPRDTYPNHLYVKLVQAKDILKGLGKKATDNRKVSIKYLNQPIHKEV